MNLRTFGIWLVQILAVAVAYCLAGKLALLLAIPPGFAAAIWPAAGIALAAILLWGYRIWPGILLGHFFVNIGTAFNPDALLKSLSLALGIGLGGVAQAMVGAFLARRFGGFPNPLIREKEIGKFLVLGGPLACLVNGTLGPLNLLLHGVIKADNYPVNCATWWVGDTIGVILVSPILLLWMMKPKQSRQRRIAVMLPLCITFILAIVLFYYTDASERKRLQVGFEKQSKEIHNTLEQDFNSYFLALYAIRNFFTSSAGEVDRIRFGLFANSLFQHYSRIQALGWVPRVQDSKRLHYVEEARQKGFPDFQIIERTSEGQTIPAAQRSEYFPVFYVEPYQGNEKDLGLDLASEPARLEALNRARDTGNITATAPRTLLHETGKQISIMICLPVYQKGLPQETVEERRQSLKGLVLGVFRMGDMVEESLRDLGHREGMDLRIYDETLPDAKTLLYTHQPDRIGKEQPGSLAYAETSEIAGRRWRLQFLALPEYMNAYGSWQVWAVLTGGIFFTSLLGAFLLILTGRTMVVEEIVIQRTAELAEKNEELEAFVYSVSHDLRAPLVNIQGFSREMEMGVKSLYEHLGSIPPELVANIRDNVDQNIKGSLRFIRTSTDKFERLINALLLLARSGRQEYHMARVDVGKVVTSALDSIHMLIEGKGAEINVSHLPPAWGDPTAVSQIFSNLITNAINYLHPERSGRIEIGGEVQDGMSHYWVKDNGVGLPPGMQAHLFQVFQRFHPTMAEGLGMGLAIVKRIVERHGGRVWVSSQENVGSAFHFTLPADERSGYVNVTADDHSTRG